MNKRLKMFLMIAVAGSVLGTASLAEADNATRRGVQQQSPRFVTWNVSQPASANHQSAQRSNWQMPLLWNGSNSYRTSPRTQRKSWGWQRSSRAEFHHPGPRKNRGR